MSYGEKLMKHFRKAEAAKASASPHYVHKVMAPRHLLVKLESKSPISGEKPKN